MNYVERHFGDWARDTAHLSMLEDGAYNRLCDLYYVREVPLPAELAACCRLVRASSKPEREAVKSVLAEFFVMTAEGWRHKRCDIEIERFRTKSGKASASAKARWGADRSQSEGNANAHANASPDAMRTHSERSNLALPHAGAGGRAPTPQDIQAPTLHPEDAGSGVAQSAAPPNPPPAFDGTNAETLNGKAIVALAVGFELPDEWGLDAERLGFTPPEVMREGEKFRQFFVAGRGKGKRRSVKGWRQSWSTWLGKAAEGKR